MRPLSAIILAAGKGTRMKSSMAKVMFPIAGKPMIERVVNTALAVDCHKIAVVVGHQKESVIQLLEADERIEFVEQAEQLGTGHAVMCAADAFQGDDGDVLILCGDVPLLSRETLSHLVKTHRESGASCTLLTGFLDDPGRYGRILRDEGGMVSGIVEFKDATDAQKAIKEWNTGIYCFKTQDMFAALDNISNQNEQGEYYLTDTLAILRNQGKSIASIVLERLIEVSGINSQEQLAALEDEFIDSIRKHWMNNGVMMHNPASIYIEDDVTLEPDVEIWNHCVIKGDTHIGEGSYIGPFSIIVNSKIGKDCSLLGYNLVYFSEMTEDSVLNFREGLPEKPNDNSIDLGDFPEDLLKMFMESGDFFDEDEDDDD
ncbi:MAG: bifunctional N-acetylglucosamine-1-phosphate uridyltransferase/glucosamine-1-phosphate acetyltransferase [Candidatus Cloacimonetes bacterium]|nr:bifunctional N-acetylglucosamine-1-phosphate uridyltransferase/glucosamine-1-phosphate acetyltransferase [Candidatus Cloacimonadota bacterium]